MSVAAEGMAESPMELQTVEELGIPAVVEVGAEESVIAFFEKVSGAFCGGGAVEALEGAEIALEGGAGGVPTVVVGRGCPEIAFGVGEDRLVAGFDQTADFHFGDEGLHLFRRTEAKFDQDVVAFPGKQTLPGPRLGDKAVLQRREEMEVDALPVQFTLEDSDGRFHLAFRIRVEARTVRRAYRLPIAVACEPAAQKQRFFQICRPVVETGEDMAVAVVFGQFFHSFGRNR